MLKMVSVSVVLWCVFSLVDIYQFSAGCEDYLKLAADAPTIEKAESFLDKALSYIEKEGLTSGDSAIIVKGFPTNDVGIWYGQVKGAKETLSSMIVKEKEEPGSVSQLDRDNALMKIREVLLDDSFSGVSVTSPANIAWYPYQLFMTLWLLASAIGLLICIIKRK